MKKKKKVLSLISSILCSIALCSLFALSSFGSKKQEETKADNVVISSGDDDLSYVSSNVNDFTFNMSYSYSYYRTLIDDENKYQFSLFLSDLSIDYESVNYPLTMYSVVGDSYGYVTSATSYSGLYDNLDNSFDLMFKQFDYSYTYLNGEIYRDMSFMNIQIQLVSNGRVLADMVLISGGNTIMVKNDNFEIDYTPVGALDTYQVVPINNHLMVHIQNILTEDSYQSGYSDGYQSGYNEGFSNGSSTSYNEGYENGQHVGYQSGYSEASDLFDTYYSEGYSVGYQQGQSQDSTVTSIFNGITTVAFVPVKFFLGIFNFEILGVNIASVVSALMSICLILIVWRAVMGGKSND